MFELFLITTLAGLSMPFGAILASIDKVKQQLLDLEIKHTILAFGGGSLLSAITFVLVPEGIEQFNPYMSSLLILAGGVLFMSVDIILDKRKTSASQLLIMLSDFIPECIALGALFATDHNSSYLLALFIALQNVPEGFNAYFELRECSTMSSKKIISIFLILSLVGPLSGFLGFLYLSTNVMTISSIMLIASGGILYSIFQDLAPKVKLERHWFPPFGALIGFSLGMIGFMISQ